MIAPGKPPLLSLVDELLAEQQTLQTPVGRFSRLHDAGTTPDLEPVYRDLIPLTAPGPGEQYAFEVDLDACSGCKSCVSGCHSLNGLDETETWRDVGHIVGGCSDHPFQQTITSACHHCADPGCLNGCPVLAYEKDPLTGIVRHLDDQCIGCSYCILKCPYDVPKYNERLGIVRKCDMCHGRLAEGEAPACVQACPTQAIKIVKVAIDLNGSRPRVDTDHFLAAAPSPEDTQPTTRYVSRRELPTNLRPADADHPRPQHAHWPLVILLSATQAALGFSVAASFSASPWIGYLAVALATLGLGASGAHLGRPLRAWRIFLGLRRSWLSREAVLLGLWFPLLLGAVFAPTWVPPLLAAGIGTVGIFCSAMIYIDTPRRFWRAPATAIRMGGTVTIAATLPSLPLVAAALLLGKLAYERHQSSATTPSATLLRTVLRPQFRLRITLALIALPTLVTYYVTNSPVALLGSIALVLGGELAERYLYFRAVDTAKMPGVAAP
ncbi:4Fe-4S dicluster domain-containing protein [Actomonas aquatica]|uniref:DmsC/YnfH family molybdoenzyme membrane anchor subunit n=1 Tax=Actomonas aquatica TaxID=2866162 RepID=A0ABZ1CC14_9BACT|nr:4Fe-4S dicluster domain-containing protein [Opitutus sp. WL0086]WRQ89028.1 DmsC/YnfH family molybdoenzyme membrane anchor subunit [Opitutus sp. WL0086]